MRAKFVYDGKRYDIAEITGGKIIIEYTPGFEGETVRRLSERPFEFAIIDPATGSELELIGRLLKIDRTDNDGRAIRLIIVKREKNTYRYERQNADTESEGRRRKTIAVGGGKGGVGKTIIAVNLALALTLVHGKSVILLDGDIGNSNCNTLLGITRIERSIENYLQKENSLSEIIVETAYPGLKLVCGTQNKMSGFLASELPRLMTDIELIDADCVVIDLGAGIGDDVLDLYRCAYEKIIVVVPQVTALQNAYSFIKAAFLRDIERTDRLSAISANIGYDLQKLDAVVSNMEHESDVQREFAGVRARQQFRIVGNMVNNHGDLKIIQNLQKVIGSYLQLESSILGIIGTGEDMTKSVNMVTPFVSLYPDSQRSRQIKLIAGRIAV